MSRFFCTAAFPDKCFFTFFKLQWSIETIIMFFLLTWNPLRLYLKPWAYGEGSPIYEKSPEKKSFKRTNSRK